MLFHAGKVREIQFPGRKLGGGDYYIGAGNRLVTVVCGGWDVWKGGSTYFQL